MRWKLLVTMFWVGAAMGDAVVLPARALCDPGEKAARTASSCCCSGPQACAVPETDGPGIRSGCCDMSAPVRDGVPSSSPREVVSVQTVASVVSSVSPEPPALMLLAEETKAPIPESLHAPPFYDLFRSYRF